MSSARNDSTAGDDYYRRFKSGEMFNKEKETSSSSADSDTQDRRDSSVTKPDKPPVTKAHSSPSKQKEPSRHEQQQPASSLVATKPSTRAPVTEESKSSSSPSASAAKAPIATKQTPVPRSTNPLPQSLAPFPSWVPFERLLKDGRPVAQTAGVMALTLACTARRATTRSSTGVGGGSPAMRAVADAQKNRPSVQELDRVLPPFAVLCQHLLPPPRTPEDVVKDFLTFMNKTVIAEGDAVTSPGGLRVMKRNKPSRVIINDSFVLLNHYTNHGPMSETDISITVNGKVLFKSNSWADAWENDGHSESGSKEAARDALEPLAKQEGVPLKDFLSAVGLYGLSSRC